MFTFVRGQWLHGRIVGGGTRLAQIAGDGGDDAALLRGVSENFRVGDDVVAVAVMSVAIYVIANPLQHCRRPKPPPKFWPPLVPPLPRPQPHQRPIPPLHS